jgi:hypothetical protein
MTSALLTVLVSSGVTAAVAIAGFVHGSNLNRQNLRAQGQRQFADQREAAYEQAIAYLLYRKEKRWYHLNRDRVGEASQREIRKVLKGYDQTQWFESNAKLVLYASETVRDAVDDANKAHAEVMRCDREWKRCLGEIRKIADEQGQSAIPTTLVDLEAATRKETQTALEESGRLEDALVDALRKDIAPESPPDGWAGTLGAPDPFMRLSQGSSGAAVRPLPTRSQ